VAPFRGIRVVTSALILFFAGAMRRVSHTQVSVSVNPRQGIINAHEGKDRASLTERSRGHSGYGPFAFMQYGSLWHWRKVPSFSKFSGRPLGRLSGHRQC